MIVVLPNNRQDESARQLVRDGFLVKTQRIGRRNLNVARAVPTLRNVVQLRRKS